MGPEGKRVKLTGPWKVKARVGPLSRYLSLDPPRLLEALSSRDMTTRFNAWRAVPRLLREWKETAEGLVKVGASSGKTWRALPPLTARLEGKVPNSCLNPRG